MFRYVWHLTHIKNLPSILAHGLRSHHEMVTLSNGYQDVSDQNVQNIRARLSIDGAPLHHFVPTFWRQRNPMMYCRRHLTDQLVWIKIDTTKLDPSVCNTTDGNAACSGTKYLPGIEADLLDTNAMSSYYWNNIPDGSRKVAAELLVKKHIPTYAFVGLEVATNAMLAQCQQLTALPAMINPHAFFRDFAKVG
ncbi:MAG: hypothetical protein AWU56_366 [Idiomarina sp. T82-3]|uniref:DUF4433 domain-containing protein n=1 Tax=Idiomarina TaxID=135575 RepID=UPI00079296C7|nr:DUF4433 domain-containing protein [Idiomarina sp. T82-3]KXS36251.1 MAG: hypothetical protein AWU56_366 [Idiomarina sp. T82-3]